MSQNIGIEIEFARLRQGVGEYAFQFNCADLVVLYQENDIIQITVAASIQLAERDAVRIENEDINVSKLTDMNTALLVAFRQRHESLDGNWFCIQSHLVCNFFDDKLKVVFLQVVAYIINVERFSRTSEKD